MQAIVQQKIRYEINYWPFFTFIIWVFISFFQHQSNAISLRPTSSLDALSRHRISEVTSPWPFHGLSSINSKNWRKPITGETELIWIYLAASRSQISKSVPNASSDSDLTRYRTLLADRNTQRGGERKSPSLSVATTAVEAAKIKVHLTKNRGGKSSFVLP
jgi:hypothetical protein